MPWSAADAPSHIKAANTPKLREIWARVANARLAAGASEGEAIREANAAVHKERGRGRGYKMIALGLTFWTVQGCEPCAVVLGSHCMDKQHEQDDDENTRRPGQQQGQPIPLMPRSTRG